MDATIMFNSYGVVLGVWLLFYRDMMPMASVEGFASCKELIYLECKLTSFYNEYCSLEYYCQATSLISIVSAHLKCPLGQAL